MLAPVMVDSSDRFQLVSVAEAARILNLSESTVRRLVKSGRLEAEQVQRPQGHVWLVKVPSPSHQPPEQPPRQIGATGADPPGPPALTAWVSSVLEPLVAELGASRHQLVSQAETIGQLRAENAALESRLALQESPQSAPLAVTPAVTLWRSWGPWLLALAALVAAALLAWPR